MLARSPLAASADTTRGRCCLQFPKYL